MQRKCSALKADEHPVECLGCYYIDLFKWEFAHACHWENSRYIERYSNTESEDNKGGHTKHNVCSCFVIWFGQSVLCYCFVLPICIGPFLLCQFQTWLMWLCVSSMCVRVLFLCVPATNLCLFSVEPVNVRGFLSIFLPASTVWGLILRTNQTIWSPQSYDVLRRMGPGCCCTK